MDEEAFLFMKGIRAALCFTQLYTLPPCFSSPDLCYHVPGKNLIKWHHAPTIPSSCFLSPLLSSVPNSVAGISGLPLISSLGSHLWVALSTFSPALAMSFILLLKQPTNQKVWFNLSHPQADVADRVQWHLKGEQQGFTLQTSGPCVLHLSFSLFANLNFFLCHSLLTPPPPFFFLKPWSCTLREYFRTVLSFCILTVCDSPQPLYFFYLRAQFSLIELKLECEALGGHQWGGLHMLSTLWERGDALHSASCCTQGLSPLLLHASADTWSLGRLTVIVLLAELRQPLLNSDACFEMHTYGFCGGEQN